MMRIPCCLGLYLYGLYGALTCCLSSCAGDAAQPTQPPSPGSPNPMGMGMGMDWAPPPFQAEAPVTYVAKIKGVMTGQAPTDAEVQAVSADQIGTRALGGLIDRWMAQPEFQGKMLSFFRNAFQQGQLSRTSIEDQLGDVFRGDAVTTALLLQNLQDSFPRTVLQLIAEGRPLTEALTTRRYMLTPPLMSFWAYLDDRHIDDAGQIKVRTLQRQPGFSFTVENSQGPIPIDQTLDPKSPRYLTWYVPTPFPQCKKATRTFSGPAVGIALLDLFYGSVDGDGDSQGCGGFTTTPMWGPAEFSAWRMVSVRPPQAGEAPTPFYDLRVLRAGNELVSQTPRIGFMSTPAFFANWPTNSSNLARVTTNQTLIVALGKSFDDSNTTVPVSESLLDKEHAAPGTVCYGCHRTLDPMRQFFRQSFTLSYHDQTDPAVAGTSSVFAFDGTSTAGNGVADLARLLSEQDRFAQAWTQKLCWYVNSAACATDDPEFQRVALAFKQSNYQWNVLVRELFSSPLVTAAQTTTTFAESGVVVSIARRDHLCVALQNRLGLADVCGQGPTPTLSTAQHRAQGLAQSIPADSYSRGAESPVLANDPNLFYRSVTENLCRVVADQVVDVKEKGRYTSTDPQAAIADMAQTVMALSTADPRRGEAQGILSMHHAAALAAGAAPGDALKSTFVLACLSPSSIGMGL